MRVIFLQCACALFLLLGAGCGGGSQGTGTIGITRMLGGRVINPNGTPIVGAEIMLLETGESTRSNELGVFSLDAPLLTEQLTLEITSGDLVRSVTLTELDKESTTIEVSVTVDTQSNQISVTNIQVWSRIIGDCDRYFENRAIIRQSVPLTKPLICTMRFFVSGDGKRLERVRGEIQVRSCQSDTWRSIAKGSTGFGINAGFGDINFTFIDNKRNCEYRIIAPVDSEGSTPGVVLLQTLTLQVM